MSPIEYLTRARDLAGATPESRNRVIDLMRVASILVVVFGHWLMAALTIQDGAIQPGHLLDLAPWTHPFTWVFQVMPVFFFVGGYANALSWRSARRRGETYGAWLRARLRRLALPVVPLLVAWGVGGWLALRAGFEWELLRTASQVAIIPTWFLAAYVVIVTLGPVALILWNRIGWWSIALGAALSTLADLAALGAGWGPIGFLNYVFVWGTVHQLGYAWVDGRIAQLWKRLALVAVGYVATLALVRYGPYPVVMVGLDTTGVTNTFPPRLTLVFLGMFQAGLVLLFEPLLARLTQRKPLWTGVVAISAQIMTIYLWHSTAMVIAFALGLVLGGVGFDIEPLSGGWWASRPLWFAVLIVITIGLMALFGRFERPSTDPRPAPPWWRPIIAVALVCAGLGLLAGLGIADEHGLNGLILTLPIIGVILGGVARIGLGRILPVR